MPRFTIKTKKAKTPRGETNVHSVWDEDHNQEVVNGRFNDRKDAEEMAQKYNKRGLKWSGK